MRFWISTALVLALLFAFTGVGAAQATPSITINDVSVDEGDRGTTNARFTVTLSSDSNQTVTVQFSTANDSATAGQDYTAQTSRTLTFDPRDRTESFTIEVLGDTTDESDERFFVNLTNATNATISDNQGIGTIRDDDAAASPSPSPTRSPSPSPSPTRAASPSPTATATSAATATGSPGAPGTSSPGAPGTPGRPGPGGLAGTGSSAPAEAAAVAALLAVVGWMLRRSFGDES
jgi:hypothetical protein